MARRDQLNGKGPLVGNFYVLTQWSPTKSKI